MTTAVFLGLALAFEAKESGIMLRPPHQPNQPLLSNQLIFRTVFVGLLLCAGAFGLFEWEMNHEDSINKARTAAVNFFCIGQSFYLLNCRSLTHSAVKVGLFSNPWVWIGIFAMIVAQIGYIYTPILHVFFHSEPIGQDEWILTVAGGFVIYCIVGLEKLIRRWKS